MMIKAKIIKNIMIKQTNKHRKEVIYKKDNKVFLLSRNVKTIRLINKLENKMLSFFKVKSLIESSYKLKLSLIIKMYDVFHFNLLRKDAKNSLSN